MSFVTVATGVISAGVGVAKLVQGRKAAKEAKEQADLSRIEMDKQKEAFQQLDTSNPYLNMENTMEDLTVNTKAAEFAAKESQASLANTMAGMNQAAGGSGIAALAQAMANQGQIAAQKASVSIAQQEKQNQAYERQAASKLQTLEREGDIQSRNLKKDLAATAIGLSSAETQQAASDIQKSDEQMWSGVSNVAGAAGSYLGGI